MKIANFNARLHEKHFSLGGTTKKGSTVEAGQHGEGLKLAVVALLQKPQNHSVRCIASSTYINFHLDNHLSVLGKITGPAEDVLFRHKERLSIARACTTPRLAKALLCADVC